MSTLSGWTGTVAALTEYDADGAGPLPSLLVVGGTFDTAGGAVASGLAAWNGSAWTTPFGTAVTLAVGPGTISAMAVVDLDANPGTPDELVIAGWSTDASGVHAESIAHWNGVAWAPFAGGLGGVAYSLLFPCLPNTSSGVTDLAVFDEDGSNAGSGGPGLHVCGQLAAAGGLNSPFHARWGPPPGLNLSLTRAGPNAPLVFADSARAGLDGWFNAVSLDPMNITYPNAGPWFGLHGGLADLGDQFQFGSAPFRGTLNGFGSAVSSVPAATLVPYSGTRIWSVGVRFDAPILTEHAAPTVTSIQLCARDGAHAPRRRQAGRPEQVPARNRPARITARNGRRRSRWAGARARHRAGSSRGDPTAAS